MEHQSDAAERGSANALLRRALLATVGVVFVLLIAAMQMVGVDLEVDRDIALPTFFVSKQDGPVAALLLLVLLVWRFALDRAATGAASGEPLRLALSGRAVAVLLVLAGFGAWALRLFVLGDYNLSRDEQMVDFDAAIYARGHLFEPIPAFWRAWYEALNVNFILPVGDREGWVSTYLPGNAALRALLGHIMPATAVGGLLLVVAGAALWRIALRLWPDSAATRTVVMLLYLGSAQVILTAATPFAMTAHMAANLLWLWLFLKRTPWGHAGAILVGFVATGLHQVVFHPLFVGPFLLLLLREKAWRELAVYVVCYAAIGLFWINWLPFVASHGVHALAANVHDEGSGFVERTLAVLRAPTRYSLWVMAENLLRFVTWNALALVPLMLVPLFTRLRRDPFIMALWLGPVVLVVLVGLILPWQGNGWGYRYLHGFIGSFVLLAGYGWHWLEQRGAAPTRAFVALTALSLGVVLPLRVSMAAGQINAYAAASAAIRATPADVVIVDEGVPFVQDLTLNRPDISNRPVMLAQRYVHPRLLPELCSRYTLAFGDAPAMGAVSRFFGLPAPSGPTPAQVRLKAAALAAGCRIVPASHSGQPAGRAR